MTSIEVIERDTGLEFFGHQREALDAAATMQGMSQRLCLYYKTGAGKTYTALGCIRMWSYDEVLVIAPPSTHAAWEAAGAKFGMKVECMSHAKFRMPGTKLSRGTAVIADEFHLFGGHKGKGWKKFDTLARGLVAPLVLASATPNYNDAERVYCIQHVLDPHSCKGGYLQFLYTHCNTEQNPFGMEPLVSKEQPFREFKDAAEYLAALPGVLYLPDDVEYEIVDLPYRVMVDDAMDTFGYNRRNHRMIASQIEERHTRRFQELVAPDGLLRSHIYEKLSDLAGNATGPMLVYVNHAAIAVTTALTLKQYRAPHRIVTGKTPKHEKTRFIEEFNAGKLDVLVGTASLATGTDGMDKVCDLLVILDDTDDDSLRRQLVGRIMPRGSDTDATKKQVYRFVPE